MSQQKKWKTVNVASNFGEWDRKGRKKTDTAIQTVSVLWTVRNTMSQTTRQKHVFISLFLWFQPGEA